MNYTDDQIERLILSVDSLTRAIRGDAHEGNVGLLDRVGRIERQNERYRWLLPFALFSGTIAGSVLDGVLPF